MTDDLTAFTSVEDCAAASDGGSLALFLRRAAGEPVVLTLDRSIAARGTARYDEVALSGEGVLDEGERRSLLDALRALRASEPAGSPCSGVLDEFISALARREPT